jgi:hypothetical protein
MLLPIPGERGLLNARNTHPERVYAEMPPSGNWHNFQSGTARLIVVISAGFKAKHPSPPGVVVAPRKTAEGAETDWKRSFPFLSVIYVAPGVLDVTAYRQDLVYTSTI